MREVENKLSPERTTGMLSYNKLLHIHMCFILIVFIFIRSELPVREHCSGVRYVCACNCGRVQGSREDPFSLRQANHDYFQMLAKQCGCAQLESIQFPVFQPSTHNYRYNIRVVRDFFPIILIYFLVFLHLEQRSYFHQRNVMIPSVAMDLPHHKTRKLVV